jgi:hypothetical protein
MLMRLLGIFVKFLFRQVLQISVLTLNEFFKEIRIETRLA